ncbi:YbdD/YjiX family protein [Nonomuraea guangzhouensis]|uniref:YbdD/YjiX family protein n=1 Tax=Nonomuraea guangzhouensis TaxID=1291555 RepID=A0ABW4G318_9ACTN|nr:YbdD/YjiX family protein [Nonomuraea guangzhouensis]
MTLTRLLRLARWYLRELTGESRYDRYAERHHRTHPGSPALSRREYERQRTSRLDENPGARCC